MTVFYVLLLVPVAIQHFTIRRNSSNYVKRNKRALTVFFFLFAILLMLRHESVGNDTKNYIHYFEQYSNMAWSEVGKGGLEPGFGYFNKIVSLISKDPQFFLATASLVTSIMIYPTYKRLCVDSSLTIALFCTMSTFVMMFSGIRQMLAIGMGFVAYEFTRRKKLIPFIIFALLATTFHTSAFMLILMYPIYHAKITKKWLYAVVPLLTVIFLFNRPIFLFLTSILDQYTKFEGSVTLTGAYTMIILFVIFAVFAFLIPDETFLDEETIGLRNFLLLSVALQMFAPLNFIAMRMNYFYIIFIPLLLPKIISYRSLKWERGAVFGRHVMVLFFLVYFFINAYFSRTSLNVFPYHFFWENVI